MDKFSEFFAFDEHAHRFSFFVHAAALFEKKRNTINLHQLTQELRAAGRISDKQKTEIDRLLTSVIATVRGVHLIRNKAFAHRDDSISFDKAFNMTNITTNNLHDLMSVALEIVNTLLVACSQKEQVFAELPLEDAKAILTALARA